MFGASVVLSFASISEQARDSSSKKEVHAYKLPGTTYKTYVAKTYARHPRYSGVPGKDKEAKR